MPLPNCGYFNKEEKKTQELVFESPPQYVEGSDSDEGIGGSSRSSSSGKRIRAKVTKGKRSNDKFFMNNYLKAQQIVETSFFLRRNIYFRQIRN